MAKAIKRREGEGFYHNDDVAQILEDIRQGMTIPAAAESWGVPVATVGNWIRRYFGSVWTLRNKRKPIQIERV